MEARVFCKGPLLWGSERDLRSSVDSERDLGSSVESGQNPMLSPWICNEPTSMSSLLFA